MFERFTPAPVDGPRLHVLAAVLEGYRLTFRSPGTALRLVLIPALCVTVVHFALFGFAPLPEDVEEAAGLAMAALGEVSVMILLIPIVLVAWQRRILLGPEHAKMRFGRREGRMLLAILVLGLMVALGNMAAMTLASTIAGLGGESLAGVTEDILIVLTNLATAYVTGRLYFMLPPRAMDRKISLREAWNMSSGYGLKLMAIVVLIGLPVVILSELAGTVQLAALESGAVPLLVGTSLVVNILFWFSLVVEAAALTVCYAALGGIDEILEARDDEAAMEPQATPA